MKFSAPILIVGFGSIGKRHTNNLLSQTNSLLIILSKRNDIKDSDFNNYRKNISRIKIYSNLNDCLQHEPQVGFITNETSLHVNYALKLAKRGMDLFIEKPLSNSLTNISLLNSITKKHKKLVMVGCNFRFYPPLMKIKQLVNNHIVGRVISVQSENGSYLPDWHPYEDYSKGYAAKKKLGGGVTLTQIHELDYLIWIFGLPQKKKSIIGKFSDLNIDADDLSAFIFELKNKILIELHLDYFSKPFYKRLKIRCSKGIIYWNSYDNKIKIYKNSQNRCSIIKIKNNYNLSKQTNQMYIDEINYFLNCLIKRKNPMNNLDDAKKTLDALLRLKSK